MHVLRLGLSLVLLSAVLVPPGAAASPGAEELLRRVESHHASLSSMSASFTQAFRSEATGQEVVERGRLFVRRPLVRFDYRRPDKKVFLVEQDGTTIAYVPSDRTAVRSPIPEDAPHLGLLRGDGDLLSDFTVREVTLKSPVVPGSRQLKLVPRRPMSGVDLVYLEVAEDGRAVHRVLVIDPLGNESDLVLDRVKENPSLAGDTFRLDLPRGVEVRDLTGGADR